MTIDINTLRPRGKWLIIKGDPRVKKTKGGIELPGMQLKAERVMEGTGHILKVGSDREGILDATGGVELEPGMRIFYRGFLKDASCAEFDTDEDGQPIFLLRAEDVMGIIGDEDIQMGAYS
jgi:co-chaperonin GroES (HSP10)